MTWNEAIEAYLSGRRETTANQYRIALGVLPSGIEALTVMTLIRRC